MEKASLIVSLHDVAPEKFEQIRRQWTELTELGLSKSSLLVVPFYHGRKTISEDLALTKWLGDIQSKGHEIVLHGWLHKISDDKNPNSNFRNWFFDNLYTSGESEFLNLNYQEAHKRMGDGLQKFQELGLKSSGFIAPAWLMNSEVERAARDHQLLYTNTVSELVHLPTQRRIPTRSCVWSTRAGWRRGCSLAWNSLLFNRLKNIDPLRISLHPCDLEYPAIWRQIKGFITQALENRKASTYGEWMGKFSKN
jgi:uncharacterized protein